MITEHDKFEKRLVDKPMHLVVLVENAMGLTLGLAMVIESKF